MSAVRERIALAADLPLVEAQRLAERVRPHVGVIKIGLSLFVEHGPAALDGFRADGVRLFLDLKLHDIPNTVELAARHAGALGIAFLTVHASGGCPMLRAAVTGARDGAASRGLAAPRILAVTALTSLSAADVRSLGVNEEPAAWAARLASLARDSGVDGLVCSPREAQAMRRQWPEAFLCTPGVRPAGSATGDQARAETPIFAASAGSNLLVVGRPIYGAADPVAAAADIAREISTS